MDLHERQRNRLREFDYGQNGAYFITICTQDRRQILSEIVGDGFPVPKLPGRIAEEWLKEMPIKYPGVFIDQYVIMPDHIHLLLRIEGTGNPSPTLGNVIGWYKYQVTKQINQQVSQKTERVFQRSYYDHVIHNQCDYNEIWEYIENNPRKWLLTHDG